MDKDTFYSNMKPFFKERVGQEVDLLPSENLIRKGIVDSFMIMEIIMHIESFSPIEIEIDQLKVENITSLENMYNFFCK